MSSCLNCCAMVAKIAPVLFVTMGFFVYLLVMSLILLLLKNTWCCLSGDGDVNDKGIVMECKVDDGVSYECKEEVPVFVTPGGDYVMEFGKYRGFTLRNVPDDYINWLIDKGVMYKNPKLLACFREMIKKGK